ncbi:hypothetical protein [Candidatus Pyrohabitans sp.]
MTKLRGGMGILAQRQLDYVTLRLPTGGKLTSKQMRKIAKIAAMEGRGYVDVTIRKNIQIPWVSYKRAKAVLEELMSVGLKGGSCGRNVRTVLRCAGDERCSLARAEIGRLYERMVRNYMGKSTPSKFKISISACTKACTHPYINDFGVVGTGKERYHVLIGGKGGRNPRIAPEVVELNSEEKVLAILEKTLEYFERYAVKGERIGDTIERMGLEHFRDFAGGSDESVAVKSQH